LSSAVNCSGVSELIVRAVLSHSSSLAKISGGRSQQSPHCSWINWTIKVEGAPRFRSSTILRNFPSPKSCRLLSIIHSLRLSIIANWVEPSRLQRCRARHKHFLSETRTKVRFNTCPTGRMHGLLERPGEIDKLSDWTTTCQSD